MKKTLVILLILILLFSAMSCAQKPSAEQFFAMDTVMSVTCYGKDAEEQISAAKEEINRLDKLLNAESAESELTKLNHNEPADEEVCSLTGKALELCEETVGAFDITLRPASLLWGFSGEGGFHVPSDEELQEISGSTGYEKITIEDDRIFLPEGMSVDLGGIAKGYASDRVADLLKARGAESAVISLGGNVRILGTKPNGDPFTVGIQDPFDANAIAFSIQASDTSVITSGSYQRFFEESGKNYHHIIDPETLSPAESGLKSVTVICENGTYADALSTALFVMGREKAIQFYHEKGDFSMILMDENGQVYYSADISPADLSEGKYVYHKISEKS